MIVNPLKESLAESGCKSRTFKLLFAGLQHRQAYFKIMQTREQKSPRRPNVRSLKIQPKTRINKYSQKDVPEIKLCGEWLNLLGFEYGTRVTVTSMQELLIIRPAE